MWCTYDTVGEDIKAMRRRRSADDEHEHEVAINIDSSGVLNGFGSLIVKL